MFAQLISPHSQTSFTNLCSCSFGPHALANRRRTNNENIDNSMFLRYQIYKPKNIIEKPDYIIFTIQNNFVKNYQKIEEQASYYFPKAVMLPNVFTLKTDFEY